MKRSNTTKDRKGRIREPYFAPSEKRFSSPLRNAMAKRRRCLMCGKNFFSKGPHNRRCKKCSQKIVQAGENAFYTPRVYSTNYRFGESLSELD